MNAENKSIRREENATANGAEVGCQEAKKAILPTMNNQQKRRKI